MPYLDGTGPAGQGPMTGRGLGYAAQGYTAQEYAGSGSGNTLLIIGAIGALALLYAKLSK